VEYDFVDFSRKAGHQHHRRCKGHLQTTYYVTLVASSSSPLSSPRSTSAWSSSTSSSTHHRGHDIGPLDGHTPSNSITARRHDTNDGIECVRRLRLHRQTGITIVIAPTVCTWFWQNCVCGGLPLVLTTLVVSPKIVSSNICKTPAMVPFQAQNVAP
jgi:hypothetical protein